MRIYLLIPLIKHMMNSLNPVFFSLLQKISLICHHTPLQNVWNLFDLILNQQKGEWKKSFLGV